MDIAIIGAGLAGVVLSGRLRRAGHTVTIFEKSRGAGGRMATRRGEAFAFDHGAPCFTAETVRFRDFLAPLLVRGLVVRWTGRFVRIADDGRPQADEGERLVAVPAMNALCKALIHDAPPHTQVDIAPISEPYRLQDGRGNVLGRFDWIVSTAPGPQTAKLFANLVPVTLAPDHMSGGFTTMLGFADAHDPGWDMAQLDDPIIASIIRNSAKPGRGGGAAYVVHARSDWSQPRINEAPQEIQPLVTETFTRFTGIDAGAAAIATTHRWRYAHATAGVPAGCIFAPDAGLAACGDWCLGGGVEAAFQSASALSDQLLL